MFHLSKREAASCQKQFCNGQCFLQMFNYNGMGPKLSLLTGNSLKSSRQPRLFHTGESLSLKYSVLREQGKRLLEITVIAFMKAMANLEPN